MINEWNGKFILNEWEVDVGCILHCVLHHLSASSIQFFILFLFVFSFDSPMFVNCVNQVDADEHSVRIRNSICRVRFSHRHHQPEVAELPECISYCIIVSVALFITFNLPRMFALSILLFLIIYGRSVVHIHFVISNEWASERVRVLFHLKLYIYTEYSFVRLPSVGEVLSISVFGRVVFFFSFLEFIFRLLSFYGHIFIYKIEISWR